MANLNAYYNSLHDIKKEILDSLLSWRHSYKTSNNEEFLKSYLRLAPYKKKDFQKEVRFILKKAKEENAEKRLISLINRLLKASNFDWEDMDKIVDFEKVSEAILNKIKELKK